MAWKDLASGFLKGLFNPAYRKALTESLSGGVAAGSGYAPKSRIGTRLRAAASYFGAPGPGMDKDERKWTKLGGISERDIPANIRAEYQAIAWPLYLKNPLARRIVDLTIDYTIGDGVNWSAKNEKTTRILSGFWKDPVNALDRKLEKKVREISIYGEGLYKAFVNDQDGHVRLGYIDALNIDSVDTDPENAEIIDKIWYKTSGGAQKLPLRAIQWRRPEEEGEGEDKTVGGNKPRLEGEAFFFAINNLSNQPRGIGDLLHLTDWVDGLDFAMFSMLDRMDLINRFIWWAKLMGANQQEIDAFTKSFGVPKPGAMFATNDAVSLGILSPDLKAADWGEGIRIFKEHIAVGAAIPPHWLSQPEGTNRASAESMGLPTIKMLERRQRFIRGMVQDMLQFAIDQAIDKRPTLFSAEELSKPETTEFRIELPKISEKDTNLISQVLVNITNALVSAQVQGWIGPETAARAFFVYLRDLGVDVTDEEKRLMAQAAAEAAPEIAAGAATAGGKGEEETGVELEGGGGNGSGVGPLRPQDYDRPHKQLADKYNDAINRSIQRQRL